MKTTLSTTLALFLLLSTSSTAQDQNCELKLQTVNSKYKTALANQLANTANDLLEKGKRTDAFRLAEFAYRYVDANNHQVAQVLYDAHFYNQEYDRVRTDSLKRYWNEIFLETPTYIKDIWLSEGQGFVFVTDVNNSLSIFHAIDKTLVQKTEGYKMSIIKVFISSNQQNVFVVYSDKTLKQFDLSTGKELKRFQLPNTFQYSFSSDGAYLAYVENRHIQILETTSMDTLISLDTKTRAIGNVFFSPDNQTLLSTGSVKNDTFKLWDVSTGQLLQTFQQSSSSRVNFFPDRKHLLVQSDSLRIWDRKTGELKAVLLGEGLNNINSVQLSPNGQYLLGIAFKKLYVWQLRLRLESKNRRQHHNYIGKPERIIELDYNISKVDFSSNSKTLNAFSKIGKSVVKWEIPLSRPYRLNKLAPYQEKVSAFHFKTDEAYAEAFNEVDKKIWQRWQRQEKKFNDKAPNTFFSKDGEMALHWYRDSKDAIIDVWNVRNKKKKKTLKIPETWIFSIKASSDFRYMAFQDDKSNIQLWDMEKTRLLHTFTEGQDLLGSTFFFPDRNHLLLSDGSIWDIKARKKIASVGERTTAIAFSNDGREFATVHRDHTKLWDSATAKELRSFEVKNGQHSALISTLTFSPNGTYLALGDIRGNVYLLEKSSGKVVRKFQEKSKRSVQFLEFDDTQQHLFALQKDNTIREIGLTTTIIPLNPNAFLKEDQKTLLPLNARQLEEYDVMEVLSEIPNIWESILAQESTAQLRAFGGYFVAQVGKNYNPAVFMPYFQQAERFYLKAAERSNANLLRADLSYLYAMWARHFYQAKDYKQAQSKALLANTQQVDFNNLGILNAAYKQLGQSYNWEKYANGLSKREVADQLSNNYKSKEAYWLYRDLDYQSLPMSIRVSIYEIDLEKGKDRFQELIATNEVKELKGLLNSSRFKEKRLPVAEKLFSIDSSLTNRLALYEVALNNGQNRFEELFLDLDNSTDRAIVLTRLLGFSLYRNSKLTPQMSALAKQIVLEDIDTERYSNFKGNDPFKKNDFVAQLYLVFLRNKEDALEKVLPYLEASERISFYFDSFTLPFIYFYHRPKEKIEEEYAAHAKNILRFASQLGLPNFPQAKEKDHLTLLNTIGWELMKKGDFETGEGFMRLGISIDPNFDCFHSNLAPALLLQGKYEEAEVEYRKWADQTCNCGRRERSYRAVFLQDLSELKELEIIAEKHREKVEEIEVWLRKN